MSAKSFIQNGTTCGIEFELDSLEQHQAMNLFNKDSWKITHDASIETDVYDYGLFTLAPGSNDCNLLRRTARITLGAELVSQILNSESSGFFRAINKLCNELLELGEPRTSERSGIHFHISLSNPSLNILKNILRLGAHYEKLFFHMGGLGYKYRGETNDSIYSRPFTEFGPPIVDTGNGKAQIFTLKDVLTSKTVEEFWNLFGDIENYDTRYHPIRYEFINIYPMFQGTQHKGTIEFRIWNKTLTSEFILAAFMMCKGFVNACLKLTYSDLKSEDLLTRNSIFKQPGEDDFILLDELCEIGDVEKDSKEILKLILKRTPVPQLEPTYIYSHLRMRDSHIFWTSSSYKPTPIPTKLIRNPNFVDIHRLRGERG